MKIRTKITFITFFLTILVVFMSNIAFEKFFSHYLEEQEESQVNYISYSVESFLNEKKNKYRGSVNDWGHWDIFYDFINDNNSENINKHLTKNTFTNLELNFIIIIDKDYKIRSKQFYNLDEKEFTTFPNNFDKDIKKVISYYVSNENTSSIMKLGDEFYFVATSEITDTKMSKNGNGKMIFGRLIDDTMIKALERITNSQVSFSTINNSDSGILKEVSLYKSENILLDKASLHRNKDNMEIKVILKNIFDEENYTLITLTKKRDLFISGMNQIDKFMLFYVQAMILILFIVFSLVGRYISKPILKLIDEVKDLDLTKSENKKLKVYGKDEFSFLINSINNMLSKIETEQTKVRENQEKLQATLASVGDGVISVDKNGKIEFINEKAQKLTGWGQEEANNKLFKDIYKIIDENTREEVESSVQKVFETKQTIESENEIILISRNGLEIAIEDTAAPIKDKFGNVIGVVLVFKDISEKKEKRKEIEFLSYHDQLTGVHNRRYFEKVLTRLDNNENLPLAVIYADVNCLKTINDAFGHEYGDLLIRQVSGVLKTEFRSSDIISRTGGDEFVILLPKTEEHIVKDLIKNIKEKIEKKKVMDINMSVSFGWEIKNNESESIVSVLKNAEDFMYKKKTFDSSIKRNMVIKSIINTLRVKHPREDEHSKRVGLICEAIGKAYNLNDNEVEKLKIAGELHDIGKVAIDKTTLNEACNLSNDELIQIKRHPETGYRLLCTSSEYYNIAEYVLLHHERWDGKGYPKGLKSYEIPFKARILSIANAYDEMIYGRTYTKPLSMVEAVEEIKKNVNTQFDPDIARTFVEKVLGMEW